MRKHRTKEERREERRRYYLANRERLIKKQAEYRAANPIKVRDSVNRWHKANKKAISATGRVYYLQQRVIVFDAYGSCCECCGESEVSFLTIDHIHTDGAEHRRQLANGTAFYNWLIRNNFPRDRFRLLCSNCNSGRHHNGGVCPHLGASSPVSPERRKVLAAYGGRCECCEEAEPRFLMVDQKIKEGAQARREGLQSKNMNWWLIRNGFPKENFRLLCWNCGYAMWHNREDPGVCPHKLLLTSKHDHAKGTQ
jgi:hypothetical protein